MKFITRYGENEKKEYVLNKHKGPTFENSKPHIILNQPGKHQLYATSKKPQGSCRGSLSTAMSFNFFRKLRTFKSASYKENGE